MEPKVTIRQVLFIEDFHFSSLFHLFSTLIRDFYKKSNLALSNPIIIQKVFVNVPAQQLQCQHKNANTRHKNKNTHRRQKKIQNTKAYNNIKMMMMITLIIVIVIILIIIIIAIIITIIIFILHEKIQNLTGFSATWFHLSSPALISKAATYLIRIDNQGLIPNSVKSFVSDISHCYVVHHCADQWTPGTVTSNYVASSVSLLCHHLYCLYLL